MRHKIKRMGTFTIPITIPVALIVVGIILVSVFYFFEEFRPIISFGGAVAGGCAAIYTAYYIGLTLKLQVQDNKIKNSITLVNTIYSVELSDKRALMEIEFKKILDDGDVKNKDMYEKIVSNRELNTAIRTSLSTLETIAVAIQEDCVSEEFMYLSTHSLTLYMEAKYKAYINAVRDDYDDRQIFIELEKLATAWRSRTYLSTGEKIL